MKLNKIIRNLISISFLSTALAFGFWPDTDQPTKPTIQKAVVQVAEVAAESTHRQVRFSGITRSARHAVLSFTVPARMAVRTVEVGDRVAAGDVLAMLDVREFDIAVASRKARVAELKARLAQAERDWRRLDRLSGSGAAATKDTERAATAVEALQAALLAAESRLAEARRVRSEAELKAPFKGTITAVRLEPGEWADPGLPVVALSGDSEFELEVDAPETVIGRLKTGDAVTVVLPFIRGEKAPGSRRNHGPGGTFIRPPVPARGVAGAGRGTDRRPDSRVDSIRSHLAPAAGSGRCRHQPGGQPSEPFCRRRRSGAPGHG